MSPYSTRHGLKTGMIVGVVLWAALFVPVASNFNGLYGIIIVGSLIFNLMYGALLGYMAGRMMDIKAFVYPKTA
jgi:hypothetical protein